MKLPKFLKGTIEIDFFSLKMQFFSLFTGETCNGVKRKKIIHIEHRKQLPNKKGCTYKNAAFFFNYLKN